MNFHTIIRMAIVYVYRIYEMKANLLGNSKFPRKIDKISIYTIGTIFFDRDDNDDDGDGDDLNCIPELLLVNVNFVWNVHYI